MEKKRLGSTDLPPPSLLLLLLMSEDRKERRLASSDTMEELVMMMMVFVVLEIVLCQRCVMLEQVDGRSNLRRRCVEKM